MASEALLDMEKKKFIGWSEAILSERPYIIKSLQAALLLKPKILHDK